MAEFVCDNCGSEARVPNDMLGKRLKCKQCGGVGPVFPDVPPAAPIVIRNSELTSRRPRGVSKLWPAHPAKKAMVLATGFWILAACSLFLLFTIGNYNSGFHGNTHVITGYSSHTKAEWLVRGTTLAAFWTAFICIPLYCLTIGLCFIGYFVSSPDRHTGESLRTGV